MWYLNPTVAFLNPARFLIGTMLKSPYQSTFGPVISMSPNTTGIARPSSAVGNVKSSMLADFGALGFGASAMLRISVTM